MKTKSKETEAYRKWKSEIAEYWEGVVMYWEEQLIGSHVPPAKQKFIREECIGHVQAHLGVILDTGV